MKKIMKNRLAALSVALLTMAGTGFAAEAQEDEWQFGVVVPLWAPRIDGDATVHGMKKDVGISFDQLKDHLDASFALGLEARKDKFGIYGNFGYMKFSGDTSSGGGAKANADLKFLIVDGGLSYRLIKTDEERPFIVEGIAGVRYWYVDTNLKLKDSGGVVLLDDGFNKDLLDPIVGLRGSKYFTPKLHLDLAGDIGGFGISDNTSTLDWSATGLVSYDFAKWFSLSAGYRALALDVSNGSGNSEKGVNLIFHGALIAAKFSF